MAQTIRNPFHLRKERSLIRFLVPSFLINNRKLPLTLCRRTDLTIKFNAIKSGWSILYIEGTQVILSKMLYYLSLKTLSKRCRSLAAFHLGLHCLPKYPFTYIQALKYLVYIQASKYPVFSGCWSQTQKTFFLIQRRLSSRAIISVPYVTQIPHHKLRSTITDMHNHYISLR